MAQTTHGSRTGFSFTWLESETSSFWRAWAFIMTGYLLLKHYNSKPHSKPFRILILPRLQATKGFFFLQHWNAAELFQTLKQRHMVIQRAFELQKWKNETLYDLALVLYSQRWSDVTGKVPTELETAQQELLKILFSKKHVFQHTC